jgi:hypothetical protein
MSVQIMVGGATIRETIFTFVYIRKILSSRNNMTIPIKPSPISLELLN